MLLICIIDFLLQIKIVQVSYDMFLLWVTFIRRIEQCLQSD